MGAERPPSRAANWKKGNIQIFYELLSTRFSTCWRLDVMRITWTHRALLSPRSFKNRWVPPRSTGITESNLNDECVGIPCRRVRYKRSQSTRLPADPHVDFSNEEQKKADVCPAMFWTYHASFEKVDVVWTLRFQRSSEHLSFFLHKVLWYIN